MSQENVDVVRRAYEAWNRGDLGAAYEFLDPDVEVSAPANFPEAGTFHGRDEMKRWVQEHLLPILEDLPVGAERFLDAGDRAVGCVRYFGRGRGTGIEVRGADA